MQQKRQEVGDINVAPDTSRANISREPSHATDPQFASNSTVCKESFMNVQSPPRPFVVARNK
jgi:hypothetical protein